MLFSSYATVIVNAPPDAWYIYVLLYSAITAGVICVVTGVLYLFNLKFGNKLQIDIHDSGSKSKLESHDSNYKFSIAYSLKTRKLKADIARVLLHIQNRKLEAIEAPFTLENYSQSHVSLFETDSTLFSSLKEGDKYHLSIFALGKEWQSKEFTLDNMSVTVVPGNAHIKVPSAILEKLKKSIADKEDSQN